MRILLVHNRYRLQGGEDRSVAQEIAILRERVADLEVRLAVNPDAVPAGAAISMTANAIWNRSEYRATQTAIARFRPDVVHVQNTWHVLSPAVIAAAADMAVPVVQSLRNYRLVCPNVLLYRSGRFCDRCVGKSFAWPGVVFRCYRGSASQSALVAATTSLHRLRGTWTRDVTRFICLSDFQRDVMVRGGLDPRRIDVKPNLVDPDPAPEGPLAAREDVAVYVGRLSIEKGILELVQSWGNAPRRLLVIGDGPLASDIRRAARGATVDVLGELEWQDALAWMRRAAAVVVPSRSPETFGRTVIEAYACGTPVVAAQLGGLAELVVEGETGHLVDPHATDALRDAALRVIDDPRRALEMGRAARARYLALYTAEHNYRRLIAIYEAALADHFGSRSRQLAETTSAPELRVAATHAERL